MAGGQHSGHCRSCGLEPIRCRHFHRRRRPHAHRQALPVSDVVLLLHRRRSMWDRRALPRKPILRLQRLPQSSAGEDSPFPKLPGPAADEKNQADRPRLPLLHDVGPFGAQPLPRTPETAREGFCLSHHSRGVLKDKERADLAEIGSVRTEWSTIADIHRAELQSSYFVVLPGSKPSVGLALIEAISAGCLVLAPTQCVSGFRELLEPELAFSSFDELIPLVRRLESDHGFREKLRARQESHVEQLVLHESCTQPRGGLADLPVLLSLGWETATGRRVGPCDSEWPTRRQALGSPRRPSPGGSESSATLHEAVSRPSDTAFRRSP